VVPRGTFTIDPARYDLYSKVDTPLDETEMRVSNTRHPTFVAKAFKTFFATIAPCFSSDDVVCVFQLVVREGSLAFSRRAGIATQAPDRLLAPCGRWCSQHTGEAQQRGWPALASQREGDT
jgi:hypothetical protein